MSDREEPPIVARTWMGRLEVTYCYDRKGYLHWVSVRKAPLLWGRQRFLGLMYVNAPMGDGAPWDIAEDVAMFYVHRIIKENKERAWWRRSK